MPPEKAVIKLYVGAPSTRIKYVNSSFPITIGVAMSHQSAYVLQPSIVTLVAPSKVKILGRFAKNSMEIIHPSSMDAI